MVKFPKPSDFALDLLEVVPVRLPHGPCLPPVKGLLASIYSNMLMFPLFVFRHHLAVANREFPLRVLLNIGNANHCGPSVEPTGFPLQGDPRGFRFNCCTAARRLVSFSRCGFSRGSLIWGHFIVNTICMGHV